MDKVFPNLAADEAAANHCDICSFMSPHIFIQLYDIHYVADTENVFIPNAFDGTRHHRLAAGGKDQGIVRFFIFFAVS